MPSLELELVPVLEREPELEPELEVRLEEP
jgi:hypothetical protein